MIKYNYDIYYAFVILYDIMLNHNSKFLTRKGK